MDLKKELPKIQKNISLANYTTFRIGGPAKYFFVAKTKNEIIKAVRVAKKFNLPFFVLGGGSNLLVSDKGFNGLVIKMENKKYKIQNSKIHAEVGTSLSLIVNESVNKSLTGLEWAVGIPGTVGGAVYGNAGWPSNKKNISSVIESVEVLETKPKLRVKNYKLKDCEFDYRDSIFKHNAGVIILSAFIKLKKGNKEKIKKEISQILRKRKEKIPTGFSAGSIFKNFTVAHKNLCAWPKDFRKKRIIPSGWLIEKCGLKGKKIGNVKISEIHANFIINLGMGKAKDVEELINLIKKEVKNKFGVKLEEEIQYLPR